MLKRKRAYLQQLLMPPSRLPAFCQQLPKGSFPLFEGLFRL